ncbi:MAG: hypothetical protein K9M57_01710 [Phycisphaerae bacterium]|nr:hypothetical protein [Phycisphaerae bacterium]
MEHYEVKENLIYLIEKYVNNEINKKELTNIVNTSEWPPVRHILHKLNSVGSKEVEDVDAELIQQLVYYCG